MTARPPCNPATLGDVCAGTCRRQLHTGWRRGTTRAICAAGHPTHDSHNRCPGCVEQFRRETAARRVHPYCIHDEGEPCRCAGELQPQTPVTARRTRRTL